MIDAIALGVSDVRKSAQFYKATLAPLGYALIEHADSLVQMKPRRSGAADTALWLRQQATVVASGVTTFAAPDPETLARVRDAVLELGATTHDQPLWPEMYGREAEGLYLGDPDGHRIDVVFRPTACEPVVTVITRFIEAFARADIAEMESVLAEDLVSYITNAEGGVDEWVGRDRLLDNIRALDVKNVKPQATITQCSQINQRQGMVMVEIKAERKGKKLHNHAAYLTTLEAGRITELRMVEALPAYSDSFWKD
ncbi:MAG: nuclear transport factor 2 family protein [Pseudomonadota bacterium]